MDKEAEASRKLEDLEQIVNNYKHSGYQISLIPESAVNAGVKTTSFISRVNENSFSSSQLGGSQNRNSPDGDRLLADANTGYHPAHLFNLDLRGMVRSNLNTLRKED